MHELKHECGVAALYHLPSLEISPLVPGNDIKNTSRLIPRMLLDLQNRGQLAAGMSTLHPNREQILDTYKEIGLVAEAFRLNHPGKAESILKEHCGHAAIGHVRYATCGPNTRRYAQPFEREHGCKWKWFCFAFNGQLANFKQLKDELLANNDYHLTRDNDTEVIMHSIARELTGETPPDLVKVFANLSKKFDGAYNIVFLDALGRMVVMRDPKGIRPMCIAQSGPLFAAASESVALANLGFTEIRSLEPGEMALVQDGLVSFHRFAPKQPTAHCFFEWIYFANVASTLDDRSVYLSRSALGKELAQQEREMNRVPIDSDTIVVPVPDTGKAAADAMAHELGLPSVEGLMRNRYVGRTFIEGANRLDKVRLKYTPLREVLNGKRVLLIEDTIVRSTTLKSLLGHLRERGGAREVHVRVACPPIVAPCFYGIDMSTVTELFAPKFMKGKMPTREEQQRMADELGADSLAYLPLTSLARCIDLPVSSLCQACVTGEYPTPTGERLYQLSLKNVEGNGRTYEMGGCEPQKKSEFEPTKVR
ncbi:amidophosphoribosyltransferase [Telmatocola sphagniphila]|uniref:Amidophosphoribosyltransferase n=1 Tax=Telmatocola sphagniphila TaxID=1123043 RepID=A0A8E6B6W6_9BACT|nr:amidophosphoribosyltransferase [Telmatocola sphagniphila]QVL32836.1 amidophosphoribosyltransferase [Telmatocola sphagniphila]